MKYQSLIRSVLTVVLILMITIQSQAQLKSGFAAHEARDMIALCNSFSYLDMFDDDKDILPEGYKKEFTSGVFGMDNKYQVYISDEIGVLNFRGSTNDEKSWLENINSAMIPAKGVIKFQNEDFQYSLAEDTLATVHAGYVLGLAYLHQSLLMQIKYLNAIGIYDIIITGHSQGGALASLLLSYFEGLSKEVISEKNTFKVYAFANPMIGNKYFAAEYNRKFRDTGWCFSIVNPEDPIPNFPLRYLDENPFKSPGGLSSLFSVEEGFDKSKLVWGMVMKPIEKLAVNSFQYISESANERLSKDLGKIEIPAYSDDINYDRTGKRILLAPFDYPKILKDSSILENDSLRSTLAVDDKGYFVNEKLYQKSPMFFQHKPHNYYVGVLKEYFREEYEVLEEKFLNENL